MIKHRSIAVLNQTLDYPANCLCRLCKKDFGLIRGVVLYGLYEVCVDGWTDFSGFWDLSVGLIARAVVAAVVVAVVVGDFFGGWVVDGGGMVWWGSWRVGMG
jgi:hypothetical protein